jgi:hypothetical protein
MISISVVGMEIGTSIPSGGLCQKRQFSQVISMPDVRWMKVQAIEEAAVVRHMMVGMVNNE